MTFLWVALILQWPAVRVKTVRLYCYSSVESACPWSSASGACCPFFAVWPGSRADEFRLAAINEAKQLRERECCGNHLFNMAERVGFEPTWGCPPSDFESAPLWPLRYLSVEAYHNLSRRQRQVRSANKRSAALQRGAVVTILGTDKLAFEDVLPLEPQPQRNRARNEN